MDYRSPLNNVFSFISGLPQGHDKPIKHALYNALALFVLFLCCASGYALFVILGPFIKPLVWALLTGSVLHPLKYLLRNRFRQWFHSLEKSHTPAVIALVIVPINITNDVSEFIGSKLLKYLKVIIAVAIAIPLLHVVYYYTPKLFIALVWKIAVVVHMLVNFVVTYSTTLNVSIHFC